MNSDLLSDSRPANSEAAQGGRPALGAVRRLIDFLGLRRSMVGVLGMVILIGLGERIPERFQPEYIKLLGGGVLVIGLLAAMNNFVNALYSYYGGYLSDRLGTKRALLAFNALSALGYLIVICWPTWQTLLVGTVFFASWSAISLPATMSLVARVLPKSKRTMGVAMHSLIRRFPMAIGPIIGGTLLDRFGAALGMRYAFGAALGMAAIAAVIQQLLIEADPPQPGGAQGPGAEKGPGPGDRRAQARPPRHPLIVLREMDPALRHLLTSDILIRFCEQIPYAFVVIWCLHLIAHPVSAGTFGVLTSIEMITAAVIYIPVAYFADRTHKKPFVLLTFVFFTLFPLALLACQSFWPLVGAFVLRGLKEFGDSTRKALILDLAPEDRKAMTFGVYYLVRDTIVSAAAFGGALLWWQFGPEVNFIVAFGFGALGTMWFAARGQDVVPATKR